MKKIAILFPGLGYTCVRPLMYYSEKVARSLGYETVPCQYNVTEEQAQAGRAVEAALEQAEEILKDIRWEEWDEILFLSKSIGTYISGAFAQAHGLNVRNALFTPLTDTFRFPQPRSIAFHGTSDPVAKTPDVMAACEKAGIPLYTYENANHSLETGDVDTDLKNIRSAMQTLKDWMEEERS